MKELGPLDPDEIKVVTFPFAGELEGGEIDAAVVTCSVLPGGGSLEDPNPDAMVLGAAVIDGTNVKQRIKAGLAGVRYQLKAKAEETSLGLVHVIKAPVWVKN